MSKSRILTAAVLASGLFAMNTAVMAVSPPANGAMRAVHVSGSHQSVHMLKTGHEHEQRHFGALMKRLDLTPEQREQAREIIRQDADERRARFEELREVRHELHRGSFGPGFDPARIGELAQRQGALMAELQMMRAERMSEIYNEVLTDAQRARLDEWRANAEVRMPGKHHRHGYDHSHRHHKGHPDRS
jgi:Spy/CpxP family protein refolding chaperone